MLLLVVRFSLGPPLFAPKRWVGPLVMGTPLQAVLAALVATWASMGHALTRRSRCPFLADAVSTFLTASALLGPPGASAFALLSGANRTLAQGLRCSDL